MYFGGTCIIIEATLAGKLEAKTEAYIVALKKKRKDFRSMMEKKN